MSRSYFQPGQETCAKTPRRLNSRVPAVLGLLLLVGPFSAEPIRGQDRRASGTLQVTATVHRSVELTVRNSAGTSWASAGSSVASLTIRLVTENATEEIPKELRGARANSLPFFVRVRVANLGSGAQGYQLEALLMGKEDLVVEVDGIRLSSGVRTNISMTPMVGDPFEQEITHTVRLVEASSSGTGLGSAELLLTAQVVESFGR